MVAIEEIVSTTTEEEEAGQNKNNISTTATNNSKKKNDDDENFLGGSNDDNDDEWKELMGKDVIMNTISSTPSGESSPVAVQPKDAVIVDFVGRLSENKDSPKNDGPIFHEVKDWIIIVTEKDVVPALELAIRFMNVGDTSEVWSTSKFAYGPCERKYTEYVLPPYSNVRYTVTVKSVIADSDRDTNPSTQIQLSQAKKTIGNDVYANEWSNGLGKQKAIHLYKRGADGVEHIAKAATDDIPDEHQQQHYTKDTITQGQNVHVDCLNNIAAVYMRSKEYNLAKKACVNVLQYHPGNRRALLRAAKACLLDTASSYEEVQAAIDATKEITEEEEDGTNTNDDTDTNNYNIEIQKLQSELKRRKLEYKKKSKDMFKGMVKETKKPQQQQQEEEAKDEDEIKQQEQEQPWNFGWKKFLYQLAFQLMVVVVMSKYFNNKNRDVNLDQEEDQQQQDDMANAEF